MRKVPLLVTGGFRSAQAMNNALKAGETDLIGLGRPLCVQVSRRGSGLAARPLTRLQPDLPALMLRHGVAAAAPYSLAFGVELLDKHIAPGISNLWHQEQLHRIADGGQPDLAIGRLKQLGLPFLTMYVLDPARDRALAAAAAAVLVAIVALAIWLATGYSPW